MQYSVTTSSQSAVSSDSGAAVAGRPGQSAPAGTTPSRTRRRTKRERGSEGVGRVFSDVSSSESDSELLAVGRKVPRLVDRLPASVREEGGVGGVEWGEGEEERGVISQSEEELEGGGRERGGESGEVRGVGGEGEKCGVEGEHDEDKAIGRDDEASHVLGEGAGGGEGRGESKMEGEGEREHVRVGGETKEEDGNEVSDVVGGVELRETGSEEDKERSERVASDEDEQLSDRSVRMVADEPEKEGKPVERQLTSRLSMISESQ